LHVKICVKTGNGIDISPIAAILAHAMRAAMSALEYHSAYIARARPLTE